MSFSEYVKENQLVLTNVRVDINQLISFLQENKNITELSLNNRYIGNKEAKALANGNLTNLTNLTKLYLQSDNISDEGAKALANGNLTNLTELNLRCNNIGDEGAKALANGNLTNLTELNMRCNNIGDEGAKALANGNLTNLTELNMRCNNIGDEGAKALANGNLINLTKLYLTRSNISDAGVKALANGNLTNLTKFYCSGDNFGTKEAKALAESGEYCEFIDKFVHGSGGNNITGLCRYLKELWSQARNESNSNVSKLDEDITKKLFFYLAQANLPKEVIEPFLDDFDKYPFLINSRDEQGHTLAHFYTHYPEMQKFFFERGMIGEERNQRRDDARIAQDNQSVHEDLIVERTKFFTKKLIECTEASEKKLKQAVSSYVESIKLFQEYQNDTIRLRLLDLNDDNKKSVMEETLGNNPVPDDKEFIQIVIDIAKDALETQYLRKNASGEYDGGYPTYEMEYEDKAKVTIPESIGYIKLMIDNFSIPLEEKKELLVTLIEQNPELVRKKIPIIRKELGNSDILNEAQFEKKELYILLNSIDDSKKIDKLFKEISDLDVENIWREQKEFALLKHIYMAATGHRGKSVCPHGTWTQIIDSIQVINTEIMEQFDLYLEEKEKREAQADIITKENIVPFIENLADRLIQYVKDNPELKEVLQNHLLHCECINIDDPEKVTFKQQKILAEINKYFSENIKGFLPNYNRNIPNRDEYRIIIAGLSKVPVLQNFALVDQGLSDAEDKSNNYVTISTDEELLDDVDQELFKFQAEEIETKDSMNKVSMGLFTSHESNSRTVDTITNFSTIKKPALGQESKEHVIQEDFIQVLQPKSLVSIRDDNIQLVGEITPVVKVNADRWTSLHHAAEIDDKEGVKASIEIEEILLKNGAVGNNENTTPHDNVQTNNIKADNVQLNSLENKSTSTISSQLQTSSQEYVISFDDEYEQAECSVTIPENQSNFGTIGSNSIPYSSEEQLLLKESASNNKQGIQSEVLLSESESEDNKSNITVILADIKKEKQAPTQPTEQADSISKESTQPKPLTNEQDISTKDNSKSKPKENNMISQNKKMYIVATSALAIAGIVSGIAIAVYSGMLALGIALGVCCLIAAAVIYHCNSPSNSVENSTAEVVNQKSVSRIDNLR